MTGDDQAIKVYDGEPSAVVFLRSLLESAGIPIVTTPGVFYGPTREIYVRGRDVGDAREIIAEFESQPTPRKNNVTRGPWPDKPRPQT